MARMLYRKTDKQGSGQKVFLAVAAYDGLSAGFGSALYHSAIALTKAGIESELAIYSQNCHVDDSRNRLVRDFLASDCTDMVFLDTDVRWPEKNMIDLLGYDRDVVAGIYPKKHSDDVYPVLLIEGEIWSDRDGLIEVEGVPTGFLRIRRNVLEAMSAKAEHYNAKNDGKGSIPCIFERKIIDKIRWGGDYVFSRKWREMGGRIYIAPEMRFEHAGEHAWVGSCAAWLKQKAGIGLVDGLKAFRDGTENVNRAFDLFDAWGNPFATVPIELLALGILAREGTGPILELGCGLSSLVMASAAPHRELHVIENNTIFAEEVRHEAERHEIKNIVVHCLPPCDGWYDMRDVPPFNWGMIYVDGPRRTERGRMEAFERIDMRHAVVVIDDVQQDTGHPELIAELAKTHEVCEIDAGSRSFAVGAPRKASLSIAAE